MLESEQKSVVLTDNRAESLVAKWDGERFGVVLTVKSTSAVRVLVLNPKEMMSLVEFAIPIIKKITTL